MANKPRKISQEALSEIYTGLQLCLLQQPEGVGPYDIWEALFKDQKSCSWVSTGISELERRGYVQYVGMKYSRKKFVLADKEFKLSPTMALNGSSTIGMPGRDNTFANKMRNYKPTNNPSDPQYWLADLNKIIDCLSKFQEAIPGLKAGLLDLTKNLERLSKVKDILGDMEKVARRNV